MKENSRLTIGTVIQRITEPAERLEQTVDSLLYGSPDTEVTGIVTTFATTQYVIEQAAALRANLIITHEGIFYSHHERKDSQPEDPVYSAKRKRIEQSDIAVYRFHDHVHRYRPDAITDGLVRALEWTSYAEEHLPEACIVKLPSMTLREIADDVKAKLGIPYVRIVGDPGAVCSRAGLLVGYRGGGTTAIPLFESRNLDLIIAGEGPEWETPEYVRDSVHQGRCKSLMLLGHAESEEPGMRYVTEQLREAFPGTPVHFIANEPLFQIL